MGQYYKPCNITKKEFLYSHTFGDGLKLTEFGFSGMGMMAGLAMMVMVTAAGILMKML